MISRVNSSCRRRTAVGLASLLAFASSAAALAQVLEEVVVTAQKREQNVQDVPIAISAYGGERLRELGVVDLSGLSNNTPNVNLDSSTPFGSSQAILSAYIRGIGSDDFAFNIDPGVGVYIDGVYLARSVGANQSLLDVERIEVLKGPQGTLFGRNTIGGAISVVTRDPGDTLAGKLDISIGSDNLVQLRGIIDGPLSDQWGGSFSFSHRSRDGYVDRVAFPGNGTPATANQRQFPYAGYDSDDAEGGEDSQTVRGKLMWQGGAATVRLSADYTKDQSSQASSLIQTTAGFEPGTTTLGDTALPNLGGTTTFPGFGPFLDLDSPASDLNGDGNPLDGLFFASLYNYCIAQSGPGASAIPPLQGGIAALCGTRGQLGSTLELGTPLFGNPNGAAFYTDNFISPDIDETYATAPNFSDLELYGFGATVDFDLSDNLAVKSITGYREQDWSAAMDLDGSPLNILTVSFEQHQEQISEEVQLIGNGLADGKLDFVLGGYYFEEEGDLQDLVLFPEGLLYVDGYNTFETQNWAVFGQVEYQLNQRVTLLIGGRYTSEEKQFEGGQRDLNGGNYRNFPFCVDPLTGFPDPDAIIPPLPGLPGAGSACRDGVPPVPYFDPDTFRLYEIGDQRQEFTNFSPKVGVQYFPGEDLQLYATYSEGYKTGGWSTRLQNPLPADQTRYDEEIASTFELGFKSQLAGNRVQFNMAAFTTKYEDIQLNFQQGISPTLQNAGDADIMGIEIDLEALITDSFSVQASVGWLDTEFTSIDTEVTIASGPNLFQEGIVIGAELPKAPEWQVSLAPRYETNLALGELSIQGNFSYASETYNQVERVTSLQRDSIFLSDLIATLKFNGNLSVTLGGKNLGDERYLVTGISNPAAGALSGTYNRGREWYLTLGYDF